MCTAMTYKTKDSYFGRTLDIERTYNESVTVMPRHYPLHFRKNAVMEKHYAMIGMATVTDGYPLYYEAENEHGLAMAGLNFPGNACYFPAKEGKANVAPFELIPFLLGRCKNLDEATMELEKLNLCQIDFAEDMPLTPLHWMMADRQGSIVVESVEEGLKIYKNPVGVMTNSPPFNYHMTHMCDFMHLSPLQTKNRMEDLPLKPYSRGMGGMGLPGDWSSASRFVRAAFVKINAHSGESETESVNQFFHMMGAVAHPRGCVQLEDGAFEVTDYTCCMNMDRGIYYYTTYENSCISAVDMHRCGLDGREVITIPLAKETVIHRQN